MSRPPETQESEQYCSELNGTVAYYLTGGRQYKDYTNMRYYLLHTTYTFHNIRIKINSMLHCCHMTSLCFMASVVVFLSMEMLLSSRYLIYRILCDNVLFSFLQKDQCYQHMLVQKLHVTY